MSNELPILIYCNNQRPYVVASFNGKDEPTLITKREWDAAQPKDDRFLGIEDAKLNDSVFATGLITKSQFNLPDGNFFLDIVLDKLIKKRPLWDVDHPKQSSYGKNVYEKVSRARRSMTICGWHNEPKTENSITMLVALIPEETYTLLTTKKVRINALHFESNSNKVVDMLLNKGGK